MKELGADKVIATDLIEQDDTIGCRYEQLDVCDAAKYHKLVKDNKVDYIIHLAGILSSLGEKHPQLAFDVNVMGAKNAMDNARDHGCQLFIPSTIGAFGGDHFEKYDTPNDSILQPKTMYGVTKVFNELLGEYYQNKFGIDFRCIRYPGVISSAKYAFNGTTDYSTGKLIQSNLILILEIFFHALETGHYKCWLGPKQALPMIYIDECIDATIQYLKAPQEDLKRCVYNLGGVSFTPEDFIVEV